MCLSQYVTWSKPLLKKIIIHLTWCTSTIINVYQVQVYVVYFVVIILDLWPVRVKKAIQAHVQSITFFCSSWKLSIRIDGNVKIFNGHIGNKNLINILDIYLLYTYNHRFQLFSWINSLQCMIKIFHFLNHQKRNTSSILTKLIFFSFRLISLFILIFLCGELNYLRH